MYFCRLTYVIEEIQLTESKYVHDLEKIVKVSNYRNNGFKNI